MVLCAFWGDAHVDRRIVVRIRSSVSLSDGATTTNQPLAAVLSPQAKDFWVSPHSVVFPSFALAR